MATAIERLDRQLKAEAPVHGVSVGRIDDKKTWRIDFQDGATAEQRRAAQGIIDRFDWGAASKPTAEETMQREMNEIDRGIVRALSEIWDVLKQASSEGRAVRNDDLSERTQELFARRAALEKEML